MKISRKMKKLFVSVLTASLSIIMIMTSASAANTNIIIISEDFTDSCQVVEATESAEWDKDRNRFIVSVDLSFAEDDYYNEVYASLELWITNTSQTSPSSPAVPYYHDFKFDNFNYSNTWDSDELMFSISNFNPKCERHFIITQMIYMVYYDDGSSAEYAYETLYTLLPNGTMSHYRYSLNDTDE